MADRRDIQGAYIPPHLRNQRPAMTRSYSTDTGRWGSDSNLRPSSPTLNKPTYPDATRRVVANEGGYGGRPMFNRSNSSRRLEDNIRRGFWDHKTGFKPAAPDPAVERNLFGAEKVLTGINFEKYNDIPVEMSGDDIPPHVNTFEDGDLHHVVLENIGLTGYMSPTPVQKHSVCVGKAGRDLMACAQTGSGKTAAFLIPTISKLCLEGPGEPNYEKFHPNNRRRLATPSVLILAPTRELAIQINDEAKKFTYRTWLRPCVIYGGADINAQIRDISYGCDLITATPGRLVDLIERGLVTLSAIKFLILDEADRMLDMGFEPQIRRIVEQEDMPSCVEGRRTWMFSATFPKNIQLLAQDFLKNYIYLTVGRVGSTSENIIQMIEYVEEEDKRSVLLDLLASNPPSKDYLTLVFTETKKTADILCNFLFGHRYAATAIHGDRTQREREKALECFRTARTPILVATAVAARGLDIPNVMHVVNFDMPSDIDDYVHRIGRTGRAGNVGRSTAFWNFNNRNVLKDLYELLRECNQEVPKWLEDAYMSVSRPPSGYSSSRGRGGYSSRSRGGGGGGGGGGGRGGFSRSNSDFRRSNSYHSGFSSNQSSREFNVNNNAGSSGSAGYLQAAFQDSSHSSSKADSWF